MHNTQRRKLDSLFARNNAWAEKVCHRSIVQRAWKANKYLTVHGWIYSIENGLLKELDAEVSNTNQLTMP